MTIILSSLIICVLLVACECVSIYQPYVGRPLLFEPSGQWDGSDGPWASFVINVGEDGGGKGQNIRVLPSLSFSIVLLPLQSKYCDEASAQNYTCNPNYKYRPYTNSASSIKNTSILTVLGLSRFVTADSEATQPVWYNSTAVGIDLASKQRTAFEGQFVAGTTSNVFNIGLFGLSFKPLDLGGIKKPTFVQTLNDIYSLGSIGFSYTAGSFGINATWNVPSASGYTTHNSTLESSLATSATKPNLVLGGYDASRIDRQSSLEVDIANNNALSATTPLYVNLTSITFTGSAEEWQNGTVDSVGSVTVYIDSSVAQLWLPLSACKVFERVFGLTWNEEAQLYLINATEHTRLQQLNTSVTFSLHSSRKNSTVRNFTLSYASFDLLVTYPLVATTSYYFPLKRASSPDQYMIGRTFLQETYISVDYGAATFNISKAVFDNEARETLVHFPSTFTTSESGGTAGTYAGIGVGVAAAVVIAGMSLLVRRKPWWPFEKWAKGQGPDDTKGQNDQGEEAIPRFEAMSEERVELEAKEPRLEMDTADYGCHEVAGLTILHELDAQS